MKKSYGVRAGALNLFAQLVGLAVCVMILYWCIHYRGGLALSSSNKLLIFNVHPVLMFIGFIFISSQAILVYRTIPAKKERQKVLHLILLGFAIILGGLGLYAVFKFHNESGIPNMYSLHSWMGMGTFCLYGIQWVAGLAVFLFPGTSKRSREKLLPWHVFLGLFLYVLGLATALSGLLEKLTFQESGKLTGRYSPEAKLVNFSGLLIIIHGVLVVLALVSD